MVQTKARLSTLAVNTTINQNMPEWNTAPPFFEHCDAAPGAGERGAADVCRDTAAAGQQGRACRRQALQRADQVPLPYAKTIMRREWAYVKRRRANTVCTGKQRSLDTKEKALVDVQQQQKKSLGSLSVNVNQ